MKQVTVYTDGACRGNPGPGGWGAVLSWNGHFRRLKGGERLTTNNRMELLAAISALEAMREPCQVQLYTDSNYLRQGITEWLPVWHRRNWRTADNKPVKNQDLWQRLDGAAARHRIEWHWVKGHSGDPGEGLDEALATTQA
jgi:ribonuclease HI